MKDIRGGPRRLDPEEEEDKSGIKPSPRQALSGTKRSRAPRSPEPTKPSRSLLMRPRALRFGEGVGLIPGRAREGRQTERRIIGGAERGQRQPIAPIIDYETRHFNFSAIAPVAESQLRNQIPSPGEGG